VPVVPLALRDRDSLRLAKEPENLKELENCFIELEELEPASVILIVLVPP